MISKKARIVKSAVVLIAAAIILFAVFLNNILIAYFASSHNLTIKYGRVYRGLVSNKLSFDGFSIIDNSLGIGLNARKASFAVFPAPSIWLGTRTDFRLQDVRFIKAAEEKAVSFNNISDLVYVPFSSRWTYREISGSIELKGDNVTAKDILADSEEIRLMLSGSLTADNDVESSISISFNSAITSQVPDMLSKMILKEENEGWKSISVDISGNFNTPSIQVSGKMFKLSIGSAAPRNAGS